MFNLSDDQSSCELLLTVTVTVICVQITILCLLRNRNRDIHVKSMRTPTCEFSLRRNGGDRTAVQPVQSLGCLSYSLPEVGCNTQFCFEHGWFILDLGNLTNISKHKGPLPSCQSCQLRLTAEEDHEKWLNYLVP